MEIKDKILKTLKDFGRISTSKIAGITGIDYNYANKILEELLKDKKIIKQIETNAVYWSLK
jgi:ribosomal protein S25